jgi:hypothetical protein
MAKKLYELLAIEGQLKDQVAKTRADLRATFEKKRHLFEQKLKTFTPNVEGATGTVEEESSIQSTAASELRWIAGIWAGAMDSSFQIAHGNTKANADVELDDGTTLLRDVPATALLELEKRAGELLDLIAAVPTLDPAKGFDLDPSREGGIYRARDVRKTRTHKVQEALVLLQPTADHGRQADRDDLGAGVVGPDHASDEGRAPGARRAAPARVQGGAPARECGRTRRRATALRTGDLRLRVRSRRILSRREVATVMWARLRLKVSRKRRVRLKPMKGRRRT